MNGSWRMGALAAAILAGPASSDATPADDPLAEYVARPDDSYRWVERRSGTINDASYAELTLTSQTWRGIVWKHQLYVLTPPDLEQTTHALLFVTGGNWSPDLESSAEDEPLPSHADRFVMLAKQLRTPVAVLLHVPQQPLFGDKREDALIALTFDEFLNTKEAEWPLLLPMVKSVVRGMDAVQEYARQRWSMELRTFTVSGASKRGWTTWLTGAVDPRVAALVPIGIDVLNMSAQMEHQVAAWGGYSHKIDEYTQRDLPARLRTKAGRALRAIVDPFSHRSRLTQPKLIIVGTNDEYWPLDALNLYWSELEGEKSILYVPNQGHKIRDLPRVIGALTALHQRAATGRPLPELTWSFTEQGGTASLRIGSDRRPDRVHAWVARSDTRDFRGALWASSPARAGDDGYTYDLAVPEDGYAALFGEAMYAGEVLPVFLSTTVRIVGGHPPSRQPPMPATSGMLAPGPGQSASGRALPLSSGSSNR